MDGTNRFGSRVTMCLLYRIYLVVAVIEKSIGRLLVVQAFMDSTDFGGPHFGARNYFQHVGDSEHTERQAILAKLVSRVSLVLEALVGVLFLDDLVIGFGQTAFLNGPNRPPFRESLTRLLCVRLYLHFLWVRQKNIAQGGCQTLRGCDQHALLVFGFGLQAAQVDGFGTITQKRRRPPGVE
jgi:hypothetical protein